jgi:gas vesicle protein
MAKGFVSGVTTGAIIGAAISMMMVPQLDKNTRRKIKRFDDMLMNMAEGMYYGMRSMRK